MKVLVLRLLFAALLLLLLGMIFAASNDRSLITAFADLSGDLWMRTTLVDLYIGLVVFWCWLAYREPSWPARLGWGVAIALTGNLAVLLYVLIRLFCLGPREGIPELLLRPEHRADRRPNGEVDDV